MVVVYIFPQNISLEFNTKKSLFDTKNFQN